MTVFVLTAVDGEYPFTGDNAKEMVYLVASSFYKCLDYITEQDLEKHYEKFIIREYEIDNWRWLNSWQYFKSEGGAEEFSNWIQA